jgi:hypothetical protein
VKYFRELFDVPDQQVQATMHDIYHLLSVLQQWQSKFAALLNEHRLLASQLKDAKLPSDNHDSSVTFVRGGGKQDLFSTVYILLEKMSATLEVMETISGRGQGTLNTFEDLDQLLGQMVAFAAGTGS